MAYKNPQKTVMLPQSIALEIDAMVPEAKKTRPKVLILVQEALAMRREVGKRVSNIQGKENL